MKDFVLAALPWVIFGLSIAVYVVHYDREYNAKDGYDKTEKIKKEKRLSYGISIGILIGTALYFFGVWNFNLGMSLGVLFGMLGGIFVNKKRSNKAS